MFFFFWQWWWFGIYYLNTLNKNQIDTLGIHYIRVVGLNRRQFNKNMKGFKMQNFHTELHRCHVGFPFNLTFGSSSFYPYQGVRIQLTHCTYNYGKLFEEIPQQY